MFQFFYDLKKISYKDKSTFYALLCAKLITFKTKQATEKFLIADLNQHLKYAFINHIQDFSTLGTYIQNKLSNNNKISHNLKSFLKEIHELLKYEDFKEYYSPRVINPANKECRIGRFFESQLTTMLVNDPNISMWNSVHKISSYILGYLEKYPTEHLELFLENLGPDPVFMNRPRLSLGFGRFDKRPDLKDIKTTLGDQKNLARIILIHFMFIRDIWSQHNKLGIHDTLEDSKIEGEFHFFTLHNPPHKQGEFFLNFPSSALYVDRGRKEFKSNLSNNLGICTNERDRQHFP